jgi:hypothetical protein
VDCFDTLWDNCNDIDNDINGDRLAGKTFGKDMPYDDMSDPYKYDNMGTEDTDIDWSGVDCFDTA